MLHLDHLLFAVEVEIKVGQVRRFGNPEIAGTPQNAALALYPSFTIAVQTPRSEIVREKRDDDFVGTGVVVGSGGNCPDRTCPDACRLALLIIR